MKPANRINQVHEYYFSIKLKEIKALQNQGIAIINLGIGSPDLPHHPDVISELNKTSHDPESNMYQPYRGINELKDAFSNWYNRIYHVALNPEKEILPLIGSKEGITHISMAFCNPGDRVLIPNPGYPAYASVSKLLNLDIQYYNLIEENNWLPDFNELESLCNERCKILWMNYPHMPTGKVASRENLRDIVMWAKYRNILLVNDNPYSLILNDARVSALNCLNEYQDIIELNSLSKSFNMSGWRIGMLGGNEENINHILKVKSNFDSGMYKPIQLAAVKALNLDTTWVQNLNYEYNQRKQLILSMLDLLECSYSSDGSGLFVWAKIPESFSNGYEFSDYLLYVLGIFAAPGSIFGNNGNSYIRVSLCANQETLNEALNRVTVLKQTLPCK